MTHKSVWVPLAITALALTSTISTKASVIPTAASNQEATDTTPTQIHYVQNFEIDSDNIVASKSLRDFSAEVDSILKVDTITHVHITGIASVDGPVSLNDRLARARAAAMKKWLVSTTHVPEDIMTTSARGEDWSMFRSLVVNDPQIPAQARLLQIIDSSSSVNAKETAIRRLDNGNTWRYLAEKVFPLMRCAEVMLDVKHRFLVQLPEEIVETEEVVVEETVEEPVEEVAIEPEVPVIPVDEWRRRFYIKTDLPYWLMTWSNLAFEVDLAPHWSFNLPIYFSAVNYFKKTIKFRTFSFQPGIRYWLKGENKGVYLEAHYGMGWWNFAFDGTYRYQDHFRKTPTMGGGVAAGYRLPVSKNGRWAMEFGGGVGVYRLSYDKFINKPNGRLVESKKKTVFFIDNVNVSISYSFPIEKRKGGDR